jgi:hypothetical protein
MCCVAEELQQLASQGPPAALMLPGDWQVLLHAALQDLKLTGRQDVDR